MRESTAERFWRKVVKTEACWLWHAGKDSCGYGQFSIAGISYGAHRVAYTLTVGAIPEGLQLDHLCRVRACVNPAHLEPVTHAENLRRIPERLQHLVTFNSVKTQCPAGHAYSGENLYVNPAGGRVCRTCKRIQARNRRARR